MARDDHDPDYGRHAEYKRRDRLLAWPKVRELYGISRTTAWRLQKVGEFPQPVHISSGRVGWRESELITWAASRTHRDETQRDPPPRSRTRSLPATPLQSKAASIGETETRTAGRRKARPALDGQTAFEF